MSVTTKFSPFTPFDWQRNAEFAIFLLPVWDPNIRGRQLGHKLDITFYTWRTGVLGLRWREAMFHCEWEIPGGMRFAYARAKMLKKVIRRMIAAYGKLPDMHGIAMRLASPPGWGGLVD